MGGELLLVSVDEKRLVGGVGGVVGCVFDVDAIDCVVNVVAVAERGFLLADADWREVVGVRGWHFVSWFLFFLR